jgi:hypothetical protein
VRGLKDGAASLKPSRPNIRKFTQVSLTHYIRGLRIPEFKIAEIISKVTGIPIFLLSFRLTHKYQVSN